MVRLLDRKLTFWLAGYYDDFTNAKAVPDDSNTMGSTWKSIETHAGNPLNGLAPYNPRYKYAWFIRGTGVGGARFNGGSLVAASLSQLHNNKIGEWLTFDPEWYNQGQYEGTTHIQYPDSKTNANRQKFDGATGLIGTAYESADPKEGFLIFCNGYNTQGQYYAFTGNTDSSYGRDTMDWVAKESSGFLDTSAGEPDNAPAPTYRIDTHLAGVYTGEVITDFDIVNGEDGGATMFISPIHSPSHSPFLVQEIYNSAASGFIPTLLYQGSLNCKGDGDIFTIRICPLSNTSSTGGKTKLLFGNSNNPIGITSGTSGDSTDGTYAVDYELDTTPYGAFTNMDFFDPTSIHLHTLTKWGDYEFLLDFTNQQYQVYIDGSAVGGAASFNAHPDGRDWTPADFYGWELQVENTVNKATILLDRVGVCRYLNDSPSLTPATPDIAIANSISYNATVNSASTVNISLTDDNNDLKLLEFFNQNSFADWSLLCFRDNVDRPFWRGSLNDMSHDFSGSDRTPKITISATDHFGDLDHQIPLWELGEGGDADSTSIVAYNRQDSQNRISTYYFGATPLEVGNASLGFNEVEDGAGVFEAHVDSRMRLRSAHPIQVYNDEDDFGINNAYEKWDDAITDGYATTDAQFRSLHSRWIQDLPKSLWFKHLFGKINETPVLSSQSTTAFNVGDTSLSLAAGGFSLNDGGHIEFIDADGSVDSGVITSATFSDTHTDIQVQWLHMLKVNNNIIEKFPSATPNGFYYNKNQSFVLGVALVPSSLNLHEEIRTIRGSAWPVFNQEWGFLRTGNLVNKTNASGVNVEYEIYEIRKPIETKVKIGNTVFTVSWKSNFGLAFGLGYRGQPLKTERNHWSDILVGDGIDEQYRTDVWVNPTFGGASNCDQALLSDYVPKNRNTGVLTWEDTNGNQYNTFRAIGGVANPRASDTISTAGIPLPVQDAVGGTAVLTLPATNFFEKSHDIGTTVNILDIDDDFKHTYILWADMRNDGNANADGHQRRDSFGLLQPASQNYDVSLVFGDQNTDSGEERQQFVDLVAGEDYEMWEMGSKDPITNQLWSAVSGGSNSESNSKYHNWEQKAGAFVIIDASKFFNLNTYSNGGMSGQSSGGKKEIGDYIVETEGFPILIDNYWKRATTTPDTIIDNRAWSPYYYLADNIPTSLREEIRIGDRAIQLLDSAFDLNSSTALAANPYNMPTGKIVSENKKSIFHFNVSHKLGTTASGVNLVISNTDPSTSAAVAGEAFISGTSVASYLHVLREGHYIKIRNSTTSPSIDGDYQLKPHIACITGNGVNWVGRITLQNNTTTITNGSADIDIEHSYMLNRLMTLGEVNKSNTQPNDWDGSSYSGIGLTSAYLVATINTITANAGANTLTLTGSATWHTLGFRKGMEITIHEDNVANYGNNGTYLITDVSGLVLTVDNLPATYSASNTINIYDKYYNTNSAEWLINNHPLVGARQNPTIGVKSPITGQNIFHEGATEAIPLDDQTGYADAVVYPNASSVFPMRLMMQIEGFTKNINSLTFFEHDKFRTTYLDSLTKNWLNQANLFGIPDIGTVPRTSEMNIGQKDAMTSGRAGVILAIAVPSAVPAGTNDIFSSNHGLVVGDVVDIISNSSLSSSTAPFSSQYTVVAIPSANEFRIQTLNLTGTPSNLGMWRKVNAVDSYGSVVDCRNTTIANIYSQVRQVSGLGDNHSIRSVFSYYMSRDSKPAFRPTYNNGFAFNQDNINVSSLKTTSSTQISNVRIFYGADGNYVDHPAVSLGAKPRWEIIQAPEISSKDEALVLAKQEFEKQSKSPMLITCKITKLSDNHTLDGANDRMLYNARFGYIADQSRTIPFYKGLSGFAYDHAMYWTSLRGGNLFTGIQNALDGKIGTSLVPTSPVAPEDNYVWYGANSLSYAVQVVHIPHGMPKTTNDTAAAGKVKADGRLRVVVDIAPQTSAQGLTAGNDIDNGTFLFRVHLLDYDFEPSGNSPATGTATLKSQTSVVVDSNGLYEIAIPSTYWTAQTGNERVLLSVNYDYLASLVKLRCGGTVSNKRKNAHDWVGATYSAGHNAASIFPLGVRQFGTAGYWGARAEFYAPRLNITDDLNFTVGTTLNYSNPRLNISNENLSIRAIDWSIDGRDSESLSLSLERDVSRAARGFAAYILPKVNMGARQKKGSQSRSVSMPDAFTGGSSGGFNGGKPKQGTETNQYGDEDAGTRRTAALQPNTAPPRRKTPDGQTSANSESFAIGSSALSRNLNRRIKGVMDFNNSSVVGDNFSILGQKKPAPAPRNTKGDQSIDSFIIPEGGSAVMGSKGFTLAGRGGDGAVNAYSSTKIHLRIPANPQSNSVRIFGRASLPTLNASSEIAVIYATATCVETGDSLEATVNVEARTDEKSQGVVFIQGNLRGADVAGNTIELLLEREAGQGLDTANTSALSVHNIQIANDTRSVSGNTKTNEFSYSL